MHPPSKIACVGKQTKIKELVIEMTKFPLGAACIVESDRLVGIVTDGDLRRALEGQRKPFGCFRRWGNDKSHHSQSNPDLSLGDAPNWMEDRESPISVLPVACPKTNKLLGMIRLHDIYTP